MSFISIEKKNLRQLMYLKRETQNVKEKEVYDFSICERLMQFIQERGCEVVHSYYPMGSEIDVKPFLEFCLKQSIQVVLPKTLKHRALKHCVLSEMKNIAYGLYNTPYPANEQEYTGDYDLIIVPGLAFDDQNYRLGYGGGFYDQFLNKNKHVHQMGICYPFQMLKQIPKEKHDAKLDNVLYISKN